MRIPVAAALLVVQAGCVYKPGSALQPPRDRPNQPGVSQDGAGRLSRKSVTGKEAPNKLISHDGSSCIVPEKQFRETELGSNATCLWSRN